MFSHLITSSNLHWYELREKAELHLKADLSNYLPILVNWNEILLNPDRLLEGRYFIYEIESILLARRTHRILVTKVFSEQSFYSSNRDEINSNNEILINATERLKQVIMKKSIFI